MLLPAHKSDWFCVSNVMVKMVNLFLFMMALVAHMALVVGLDQQVVPFLFSYWGSWQHWLLCLIFLHFSELPDTPPPRSNPPRFKRRHAARQEKLAADDS